MSSETEPIKVCESCGSTGKRCLEWSLRTAKLQFCSPDCLVAWQRLVGPRVPDPDVPATPTSAGDNPRDLVVRLYELAEHPAITGRLVGHPMSFAALPPATGNALRSLASAIHAGDGVAIAEMARATRAVLTSRDVAFHERIPPPGDDHAAVRQDWREWLVRRTALLAKYAVVVTVVLVAIVGSRFCR